MESTPIPIRDEAALLHKFREGDEDAFRRLFERDLRLFLARVRQRLPAEITRKVSVADILQEARLTAFQRRKDFEDRGPDAFRNWVLGILDRKARDAARMYQGASKRAAGREVSGTGRPPSAQWKARGPSPSEAAIGAELATAANRAMLALPAHYRDVLRMKRQEGLSLQEIASRTGRTPDAVRKLHGRALAAFGKAFAALRGGRHGD